MGSGDGIGSHAPASVGLIYDVFTESEMAFGMPRRKQKAARSTPHDRQDSDIAAGSVPRPISHEDPHAVADDGVTGIGQWTEVASDDVGSSCFSRGAFENGSTPRTRQESYRQEAETDDARSECLLKFTGDCRPEIALRLHMPSPPQARTRERSRSSIRPTIPPDDGATPKRASPGNEGDVESKGGTRGGGG
ncbi:uncharacterized protein Z518_07230 [Rhinocladiella mackenziei CBS 650.93]|uniref:Rhinocladiella mackenziei CBS 650.93 unplaced genomic scaffold supercont1.5, whole genome shotgun sequence n=1 Tax=Rhinocladiella mackenziei CBS 650.93 TaxID=1442369 RepID=A0A0D2FNN0_9EURO|nr:uncharacterized protein Z518_07230 [Rhinocladiella mackenziei CBS 650.93]KIX03677.1 hypothetical protein Z518_07230 [Rhinocladiella mackenziei CBS 650.93]